MIWNRLDDQLGWDDVGGRLLTNLARGIYSHEAVLREYVQNAVDAYKAMESSLDDQSIIISPEGNDLCIQDSGIGMNEREIRDAKKIAVSTKAELEEMVGFRGIGIWAGFEACERLIIDSTKQGDNRRYQLTIEFAQILEHAEDNINIKELIDRRYQLLYRDADPDEHYTRVTLKNIIDDYKRLLDEKDLTRIIAQVLPCRIDPNF
jgi:HSP90 family molecular chaperone